MKVVFFGLGSIGQRHLENFQLLCHSKGIQTEIHAMRTSERKVESTGVKNLYQIDALDDDYDIAFVTNPTSLHYETVILMQDKTKYFFIEKPIFNKIHNDIANWKKPEKYYIACPLRYKKIMDKAKEIIKNQKVLNARVICSTYLPNWRQEDYRKSYSATPELGGGVELDCIHELDYIIDLFGLPDEIQHMFGKVSSLEIQSHDTALYLLKYADKYVELHLDYYGKYSQRKIELITENDLITIDLLTNNITFSISDKSIYIEEEYNQIYLNEMNYLIEQVIECGNNHNNLLHAHKILKLALGEKV